ncbi:hypothetical protein [Paenibacillus contaminans]|nr:hypothetical protein [Paenibacillus contaminans]
MRKIVAIALAAAILLGGSAVTISTGSVTATPPNGGMNDPPEGTG